MTAQTVGDHPNPPPFISTYLLVNQNTQKVRARLTATPATIEMLNKPHWMKSKRWEYIREDQCELHFVNDAE
jgi:hypothetical protein